MRYLLFKHLAIFHYKAYVFQYIHVGKRIAGHGNNNIGVSAGGDHAHFTLQMQDQVAIGKVRGEAFALADGTRALVTIHPSALLRIQEEADKRAAYAEFVKDLKIAARLVFKKAA